MNRDLAFGASGVVIAGGYYRLATSIPDSALADAVGPQGLPVAYAAVLALLSLILIARSLRPSNAEPGSRIPDPGSHIPDPGSRIPHPGSRLLRVAGMLAFGALYIVLVPWLGYTASLAGLLFAVTWYLGGTVHRSMAVVAVSGAVVLWLLFVRLLGIPHPAGIWAGLF